MMTTREFWKSSPSGARYGVAMLLAFTLVVVQPPSAQGHGIWGHVHVTGWAAENLPPGPLRDFFADDPAVFNALLFGAAFADSGYWPQGGELANKSRAYSEHTHWEPFISDFIAWIRVHDPPPWMSLASRQRVAFLMGCAAHGLQDEIFDSLFLFQTHEHDGIGQDEADPASDGYLSHDGHLRFRPEEFVPMDALLELYAGLPEGVTEETIRDAVGVMTLIYVNDTSGPEIAESRYDSYAELTPWLGAHYLDPAIPGSLRSEILPTRRYLEVIWKRLHGTFGPEDWVMAAYPETPLRLLGPDAASPDSWVTILFGVGTDFDNVTANWTADASGSPIGFSLANTRWNQRWTRLARLQPETRLEDGAWYTVSVPGGVALRDGTSSGELGFELNFQVACLEPDSPLCPEVEHRPARIDGPTLFAPSPVAGDGPDSASESAPETSPDRAEPAAEPTSQGCQASAQSDAAAWICAVMLWFGLVRRRRIRG